MHWQAVARFLPVSLARPLGQGLKQRTAEVTSVLTWIRVTLIVCSSGTLTEEEYIVLDADVDVVGGVYDEQTDVMLTHTASDAAHVGHETRTVSSDAEHDSEPEGLGE